ncbi:receptor-like serine/threonine-protein kinase SD1-8 isoform X1 [Brassica rapa]
MKGVHNIYHHSYTFSFLLVFLALILFHPALSTYVNTMSSSESLTISSNRTLVSPGGVFELGFFKPSGRSRWYLGIWYKKVSQKTYAWVANRDNPLSNSIGTLKISGNNLVLLGQSNNTVWSTNLTRENVRSPVIAELLPNGNFVMRYSNNKDSSGFLWQSFDFPTDTLLPEMKLGYDFKTGRNRFLTSWRSYDDPSSGKFTYELDIQTGLPEFILINRFLNQRVVMQRSGPWNGIEFSGIPEVQGLNYMVYNYTENSEEIAYSFQMTNQSIYSRLTVSDYTLNRFTRIPPSWGWSLFWSLPTDVCDSLYFCGSYSYCDLNTSPYCNCIRGFVPKNRQRWDLRDGSHGCVRTTQMSCSGDGFLRLNNMNLPDTKTASVDRTIDVKKCEEKCLSDCNCTSFATADVRNGGLGCVFWTGDLVEIRKQAVVGQDLYVRLNAADLDFSSGEKRDRTGTIIGWSIGVSVMLILSVIVFCFWRRRQKQAKADATPIVGNQVLMNEVVLPRKKIHFSGEDEVENLELSLMEFEAVVTATEHFSDFNKVGKGGFGVVYKGRLVDGQEIAVKRLSEMSAQGTDEFMNEVRLIAKLQHNNLVRLLGCCVYEGEKILIYEYLENLSLDSHLFDETRSCMLNWQMRFDIINGIARGLLYLHQDSRFRIIHRDLKASNVLLDKDMTPKISDFGMARIFGQDETEADTRKVVGTYGYMSPEYAMNGTFSMKSDVFSFGVLLLEIISGKRNKGFCDSDSNLNLLGCVWRNWKEGQGLEIVDRVIIDSSSPTFRPREILRCLQIGLLCVQERVEDRPMMSSVVLMLGSETALIPQPKQPGYCVSQSSLETYSSWSKLRDDENWTVNQITMSIIDAR